jgi:hypothetical protein
LRGPGQRPFDSADGTVPGQLPNRGGAREALGQGLAQANKEHLGLRKDKASCLFGVSAQRYSPWNKSPCPSPRGLFLSHGGGYYRGWLNTLVLLSGPTPACTCAMNQPRCKLDDAATAFVAGPPPPPRPQRQNVPARVPAASPRWNWRVPGPPRFSMPHEFTGPAPPPLDTCGCPTPRRAGKSFSWLPLAPRAKRAPELPDRPQAFPTRPGKAKNAGCWTELGALGSRTSGPHNGNYHNVPLAESPKPFCNQPKSL